MDHVNRSRMEADAVEVATPVEIKNVTVAGITGAIGPTLVEALCEAGFEVQALTRSAATKAPIHDNARVVQVDYTDSEGLQKALAGQDAVVSTLGDTVGAVRAQEALISTSLAAGVKRFIPSEYGSDTMNERVRSFPFFADKIKHQDLLKKAAAENEGFSYSIIITGPFLDWGLSVVPVIINVGTRSAELFDGGDVPFSTTRVTTLSKAIVAMLKNFEVTANRKLYIHDAVITQNQLIACAERLSGNIAFSVVPVNCKDLEKQAWNTFNDPSANPLSWIFSFINISIWSGEALCVFQQTDNELLGITTLHVLELDKVLEHEIGVALRAFSTDGDVSSALTCSALAEKAFEDGKRRLVGCQPARSE